MKHLKKFEQLNEGKLNEVYGKRQESGYSEERFDPDLKDLLSAVSSIVEASPITFDMEIGEKDFTVRGPFNIFMKIQLDMVKNPEADSMGRFVNPYTKAGVKAYIDKTTIKAATSKELWEKLQKSYEFKEFIKGSKIEKLREGRVKNIIKEGKTASEARRRELFLDYLYYTQAEMITNKSDSNGPYATTSTSIRTYKYDLTPLSKAWDPKIEKPDFDGNKDAQKIYKKLIAEDGYYQGPLEPDTKIAFEKSAIIDVDDLGDGLYDVYTFTPYMRWEEIADEQRSNVIDKLGFKSRSVVQEKVSQYGTQLDNDNITLTIKVETTVWHN